jgi:hypothetical protein
MDIKNITIKEYFTLSNTLVYDSVFEFLKPTNEFRGKRCNFKSLSFDEVSVLKKIIGNPTIDNLRLIYKILYKEWFDGGNVIEFMQSYKWILDKIKEVGERENKLLKSDTDYKLVQAGINNLNKFGILNTKINLAERFGVTPKEIGQWKYIDVLHIQSHGITTQQIQKNLSK